MKSISDAGVQTDSSFTQHLFGGCLPEDNSSSLEESLAISALLRISTSEGKDSAGFIHNACARDVLDGAHIVGEREVIAITHNARAEGTHNKVGQDGSEGMHAVQFRSAVIRDTAQRVSASETKDDPAVVQPVGEARTGNEMNGFSASAKHDNSRARSSMDQASKHSFYTPIRAPQFHDLPTQQTALTSQFSAFQSEPSAPAALQTHVFTSSAQHSTSACPHHAQPRPANALSPQLKASTALPSTTSSLPPLPTCLPPQQPDCPALPRKASPSPLQSGAASAKPCTSFVLSCQPSARQSQSNFSQSSRGLSISLRPTDNCQKTLLKKGGNCRDRDRKHTKSLAAHQPHSLHKESRQRGSDVRKPGKLHMQMAEPPINESVQTNQKRRRLFRLRRESPSKMIDLFGD